MKTKKRRITVLVSLLLVLTFVLSACGNKQSVTNSPANETQTAPPETENTSTEPVETVKAEEPERSLSAVFPERRESEEYSIRI